MSHLPANRAPDPGMLLGGQQRLGFSQQGSREKCTDRITECSLLPSFRCEVSGVYHLQYFHVYEFLIHRYLGVENWEGK